MRSPIPRTAYLIRTERLALRSWSPADAPRLRESLDASDQHLRPFIPSMRDEPRSLEATVRWLRERRACFDRDEVLWYAVLSADEEHLIGEVMFKPLGKDGREIGYWVDARRTGRGYATEATGALVRIAFEVEGVRRVEILCAPENEASAAIPSRLGFTHEATLKQRLEDSDGRWHDCMVWSLFPDGYEGSAARQAKVEAFDSIGRALCQ